MKTLKNISKGYGHFIIKSLITVILPIISFLIVISGLSFLIVLPLWSLATTNKELYSNVVLITSGSALVLFLLYKTISKIVKSGFKHYLKTTLWPIFRKVLMVILLLVIISFNIQMYYLSIIVGIIITLLTLVISGYFKFAFKK